MPEAEAGRSTTPRWRRQELARCWRWEATAASRRSTSAPPPAPRARSSSVSITTAARRRTSRASSTTIAGSSMPRAGSTPSPTSAPPSPARLEEGGGGHRRRPPRSRGTGAVLAMLFIDGGHSQAAADADYAGWTPSLIVDGTLAIHDVFPDPAEGGRPPFCPASARAGIRWLRGGRL